ncbi:MAG: aminotransferase class I/II-fold pyridoxal phosphate-dependent enzyme, partial [Segetibacter sp.]
MEIKVSERLNGIGEYYFSQKLREIEQLNKQGKNIINLGIGSPDLPPHPDVVKVLQEESSKPNTHAYQSYKGSAVLRNAIANFYKKWYQVVVNPDTEVLPLIGSKEGIMHICMTYLNNGDEALIPNPGYPTYSSAVKLAGGRCVEYALKEENNWEPDFDELEKSDLTNVKLMWINYPERPTGKPATTGLFEEVVAFGRKHNILICHDNPYSFILNNKPISLLSV